MTATPSDFACACSDCGTPLWAERAGEWTLAHRLLKLTPEGVVSRCPKCRALVPLPHDLLLFLAERTPVKPLDTASPPRSAASRLRGRMIMRP